jgi:hypothetical protein
LTVGGVFIGFVIGGIGLQVLDYGRNWVYGVVIATVAVVFIVLWRRVLDEASGHVSLPPPREPGKIQNALEALSLTGGAMSALFFIVKWGMKLFAYNADFLRCAVGRDRIADSDIVAPVAQDLRVGRQLEVARARPYRAGAVNPCAASTHAS